ncbi:SusC/RagA family TonB-linked outer membrane protein (plasmid) [Persicobacter psychrovividus]|uniref:SusC/RagA family TonB-linked outer membrane protein n=2 Tax=Persicobacter psychrovividus TaxID=387638 RepID=A0ABM7VJ61_9BACT|nr:SusC/RagA family TonB-linked outer membrane protein [Persicobacter psychrovividus]
MATFRHTINEIMQMKIGSLRLVCTIFLVLLQCSVAMASSKYASNKKFVIKERRISIEQIIQYIEQESDFYFFYEDSQPALKRVVNANFEQATVDEILTDVLKGTDLVYEVVDKYVAIKKKGQKSNAPVAAPKAAQQETIDVSGTVLDEDGEGMPGVSIVVKGTTTGTVTDYMGQYTLKNVTIGDVLVYSFVGYNSQEIPARESVVDVKMSANVTQLEELVVVGYGVQKKSVVTGAIASVSPEEITAMPVSGVDQALQGRTAGVDVMNNSGAPGAGVQIRVRGVGTNGDSSPLYIVDGLVVTSIANVNPNDIESMEVLKDAASAAIYGSRGANGVVLITTKKGQEGAIKVSYDGYYGVQNAWKTVDVLDARQYMAMQNEVNFNDGRNPLYSRYQIENPENNTDWQSHLFTPNAPIQNHNVSMTGGSKYSTFAISAGYFGQQGIIGGDQSAFDRINLRMNSEHKITSRITFGENLSIVSTSRKTVDSGLNQSTLLDPLTPHTVTNPRDIRDYDNLPHNPVRDGNGNYYGISSLLPELYNPAAKHATTFNENFSRQVQGNFYGKVKIIEGLEFKSDFGFRWQNQEWRDYTPVNYLSSMIQNPVNSVSQTASSDAYWQWENVLTYNKNIGTKHTIGGVLGTSMINNTIKTQTGYRTNINPADWNTGWLDNGANDQSQRTGGSFLENRLLSYFGRVNYDYDERYMFTATVRYDGSSRFGENNRFGVFPSISAGWNVHNESFFNSSIINHFKVRGSWGQVGNEAIGRFNFLSTVGQMDANNGGALAYPMGPDGTPINVIVVNRAANPDLKWETSEQSNVGVDLGFLDDKFMFTTEYYNKTTKDLLSEQPVPGYVGQPNPMGNIGTIRNQGVELSLNYRKNTGDFNFDIRGNIAFNRNEVTEFNNADGFINGWRNFYKYDGATRMQVGHSLPFFAGYQTNGIFQNQQEIEDYVNADGQPIQPDARPGDIRFVDTNGDGEISADDYVDLGSNIPDFNYGINFNASYKNFDFSMFWQGVQGGSILNINRQLHLGAQNYWSRSLERWTGEGSTNSYPRATQQDPNQNYTRINDMVHVEDGSYLRLKNMQIGYVLPEHIAAKIGAERVRVYISGQNLLTFTKYTGFDPEVGQMSSWRNQGLDIGNYPQARTYLLGVNVSF